jgi:hypothetical protein
MWIVESFVALNTLRHAVIPICFPVSAEQWYAACNLPPRNESRSARSQTERIQEISEMEWKKPISRRIKRNTLLWCVLLLISLSEFKPAKAEGPATQIHSFKITILSTMLVGEPTGIGEWGFAALVDADGHKILIDTGSHPETVLQNIRELHIDLSDVEDVVLTHYHWDHIRGLMALRREMMKKNPKALSTVYVAQGIFDSRPSSAGERNDMIGIKKEFEATGGRFVVHTESADLFAGVWLTGPVPRPYPERNWTGAGRVQTASGLVEDNIPEDQSLVLNTSKRPGHRNRLRTRGNSEHCNV